MQTNFLTLIMPRYWVTWLGLGFLWLCTWLPYKSQLALGRAIGRIGYLMAKSRRKIAATNIARCLPDYTPEQQQQLLIRHFESLGMGLIEMATAWWVRNEAKLASMAEIQGFEYLETALARGKGIILLSAHFTSLELAGRFLTMRTTVHSTYRPHENPVIEYIMHSKREKYGEKAIPRDKIRDMISSLKQNKAVWFAVDQNFSGKYMVFARFFGISAATNTATSRLARLTKAAVVPFFVQRLANAQYRLILLPALTNFPTDDAVADAELINELIAKQIRQAPEQYWWLHRRFKHRPEGESDFY